MSSSSLLASSLALWCLLTGGTEASRAWSLSLSRDRPGIRVLGPDHKPPEARGGIPGRAGEPWRRKRTSMLELVPGRAECTSRFPCLHLVPQGESWASGPAQPCARAPSPHPHLHLHPTWEHVPPERHPQTLHGDARDPLTVTSLLCPQTI